MKLLKCLFLVSVLFSPSFLYAQILEPRDMDIFISGYDELEDVFAAMEGRGGGTGDYLDNLKDFGEFFSMCCLSETAGGGNIGKAAYASLKTGYQRILELAPPRELEEVFTAMGWEKDGQKKCMTILFIGSALMDSREDFPPKKILSLFGGNDVSITKSRIHDLGEL